MTLNLALVSDWGVFLSGDFRVSYPTGRRVDNLDIQKLVPVFKFGWSALVSVCGVASTPKVKDVSDWLSEKTKAMDFHANFEELPRALLSANEWLRLLRVPQPLGFTIVAIVGKRPRLCVISNFTDTSGHLWQPLVNGLRDSRGKISGASVHVFGDTGAVTAKEKEKLLTMVQRNWRPLEIQNAMAEVNYAASKRSLSKSISPQCVTGHLLGNQRAELIPHGIPANEIYIPGYVRRDLEAEGNWPLTPTRDDQGRPLLPQWVGSTSQFTLARRGDQSVRTIHAMRNVAES
jgi:hypothetical protein